MFLFWYGFHSLAISGCVVARSLKPGRTLRLRQYGQPGSCPGFLVRFAMGTAHSCPSSHFHHTRLQELDHLSGLQLAVALAVPLICVKCVMRVIEVSIPYRMEPPVRVVVTGEDNALAVSSSIFLQRAKPFPHRHLSLDMDHMGVVDQAVNHRVGDGALAELRVPCASAELRTKHG